MRCCRSSSSSTPTGTNYDEERSDRPQPTRQTTPTSNNCTHRLCRVDGYLSLGLGGLLGVCALLLPIAWFIVVPFFIDIDALAHKYEFKPMPTSAFDNWQIALLTLVPLMLPAIAFGVFAREPGARLALVPPVLVIAVMLVVGNALSMSCTSSRLAYKSAFAVKFNQYYCDTRTLRTCLDSKSDLFELVLLTRGNLTATSAAVGGKPAGVLDSETATAATLAIWTRCKAVVLDAMATETARDNEKEEAAEMEIETGKLYQFVDDCGNSREMDAWCGSLVTRMTPFTATEHESLPAPFATSTDMFTRYTREWSRRMVYSNALLAPALGCMVLGASVLRGREVST